MAGALLALPWLWPFTSGPTAAVEPYLVAAAAAGLLLALWPRSAQAAAPTPSAAGIAAAGWLAAALVSSVIALLQYFHLEARLFPWVDGSVPGQAFGNLRQTNLLATLLVIGLFSLRWWFGRMARPSVAVRTAALAAAALLLAALAATASRVGIVELAFFALLALVWARAEDRLPKQALVAAVALTFYVLATLALPWLLQSWQHEAGRDLFDRLEHAESTCGSRLILWRNVLHLIALHPWTGWGWGQLKYAHYITLFDGPRFCHILDNAHNLPLHLAVELGVPVALAACALALWLIWRGRPWAETDPARQLAWGVLGAVALHSMVEYPLWYGPFQIAALLGTGLLWRPQARTDSRPAPGRLGAWAGGARYALAALLLAACAYAWWDYGRISQIYLPPSERASEYRDDPLTQAQNSWLFAGAVRFAELTTQPPTRANAQWMLPAALQSLHYSPEPSVIERVIESAAWLGQDDLALAHMARYKAAFPKDYEAWTARNRQVPEGAQEGAQEDEPER
jgi:O-antigen ligase